MAVSNPQLIEALRNSAQRLEQGARYEWGHPGRCNCGHLVQTLTQKSAYEIVQSIDFLMDQWTEYANDYCAGTGHKLDDLFLTLQQVGFGYQDVIHLENLSDPGVLKRLPAERRHLRRNCVTDVVLYMYTLADLLEDDSDNHQWSMVSDQWSIINCNVGTHSP